MMIRTASDQTRSSIRVGNSGAPRNMPLLASQCQKTAQRAELVAPKTGGMAAK
jgi:hypothetical protein